VSARSGWGVGLVVAGLLAAGTGVPLGAQSASAAGSIVSVTVAPERVTIGAPFTVRVRVRAPRLATITFPAVPDSLDAIEALDPRFVEDSTTEAVLDRTAVYRFAAWDVGARTVRLDAVTVAVAGAEATFAVRVPSVDVQSVLPADSADRVAKDARAPIPDASSWWRFWLVAAILALIAGALWRAYRRRAGRAVERTAPSETAAYVAANAAFRALDLLALIEAGEPGRALISHVDVVRAYLSHRVEGAHVALSVEELLAVLHGVSLPILPERITALLALDAPVRFADARITAAVAADGVREAQAIVHDIETALAARRRIEGRETKAPGT
jgi:hypothetical protein